MSQAFAAVKAGEESLLCRSYSRYPLAIVRGKGSRLWDVDGKEYVDLLAGAWRRQACSRRASSIPARSRH